MIKAVIFDIDGVLLDSKKAIFSFFNDMLKIFGFKEVPKEKIDASYGKTTDEWIHDLTGSISKEEFKRMIDWAHKHYFKNYLIKKAKLFSNSVKTLEILSKKYLLFIITNNEKPVMKKILENYKIKKYFKKVLSRNDIKKHKPSTEGIKKIMKEYSLKNNEVVYVGDTTIDAIMGNKAKVKTIIVGKREIKTNGLKFYRINKISELTKLIKVI